MSFFSSLFRSKKSADNKTEHRNKTNPKIVFPKKIVLVKSVTSKMSRNKKPSFINQMFGSIFTNQRDKSRSPKRPEHSSKPQPRRRKTKPYVVQLLEKRAASEASNSIKYIQHNNSRYSGQQSLLGTQNSTTDFSDGQHSMSVDSNVVNHFQESNDVNETSTFMEKIREGAEKVNRNDCIPETKTIDKNIVKTNEIIYKPNVEQLNDRQQIRNRRRFVVEDIFEGTAEPNKEEYCLEEFSNEEEYRCEEAEPDVLETEYEDKEDLSALERDSEEEKEYEADTLETDNEEVEDEENALESEFYEEELDNILEEANQMYSKRVGESSDKFITKGKKVDGRINVKNASTIGMEEKKIELKNELEKKLLNAKYQKKSKLVNCEETKRCPVQYSQVEPNFMKKTTERVENVNLKQTTSKLMKVNRPLEKTKDELDQLEESFQEEDVRLIPCRPVEGVRHPEVSETAKRGFNYLRGGNRRRETGQSECGKNLLTNLFRGGRNKEEDDPNGSRGRQTVGGTRRQRSGEERARKARGGPSRPPELPVLDLLNRDHHRYSSKKYTKNECTLMRVEISTGYEDEDTEGDGSSSKNKPIGRRNSKNVRREERGSKKSVLLQPLNRLSESVCNSDGGSSMKVEWDSTSRSSLESPTEPSSSATLLSYNGAKERFESGRIHRTKMKKNKQVYSQMEDLGLGFIRNGEWVPSDVITPTIWRQVLQTLPASCRTKWRWRTGKKGLH